MVKVKKYELKVLTQAAQLTHGVESEDEGSADEEWREIII